MYAFGADELLDRIRRIPAAVGSSMLLEPNPVSQELALMIAGPGPRRDELETELRRPRVASGLPINPS
jgi:hypothetical protein